MGLEGGICRGGYILPHHSERTTVMMNASYVNRDVGVDDSGDRGRHVGTMAGRYGNLPLRYPQLRNPETWGHHSPNGADNGECGVPASAVVDSDVGAGSHTCRRLEVNITMITIAAVVNLAVRWTSASARPTPNGPTNPVAAFGTRPWASRWDHGGQVWEPAPTVPPTPQPGNLGTPFTEWCGQWRVWCPRIGGHQSARRGGIYPSRCTDGSSG
jgi:hypothetical protein